ncbi:MAG: M48 family metalloprotease [Pseudomonadota bacterium]
MNFFEHQDKARRQSRWILLCFIGVTLLIVLAVDLIVLLLASSQIPSQLAMQQGGLFSVDFFAQNLGLLLGTSAATASVIGIASLGKIASLSSGGGKVARDLGGAIVTPDTRDPLRRRLYNVVEEIAIASGTAVPEVYVMENEPAINAFAAGYTAADAAVAVTQGTLEKLSRAELQGVIAHEFSHIFNGDMRINIRMMGIIFGIMVIAIIGRNFLHSSRYRVSSSRDNNGGAIVAIGLALMLVGYIGLFFARWMKSALSRQREYLADASAVQFTRDPDGIAGALKKIAAYNHSSYLKADPEEVSHMLFGSGYRSLMFATHPPLESRIERLESGFSADEIESLAKSLVAEERREHLQAERAEQEQAKRQQAKLSGSIFDPGSIIENIGNPDFERILAAALLTSEIPEGLNSAAHSLEWVPEVLFYCLLDEDKKLREKQLLIVTQSMGDISESKLSHLIKSNKSLSDEQRLPLVEICFPTLKRRPIEDVEKILKTIFQMVVVDNQVDSFEFCLSRLVAQYLKEASYPATNKLHGKKKLADCINEVSTVVSIIASHGQADKGAQGLQDAQKAYRSGMSSLGINHTNLAFSGDWQNQLDAALKTLDDLDPQEKYLLVQALCATVTSDN